ncbi:MAG: phage holin family protein [Steroidobacteraceae bacterium]
MKAWWTLPQALPILLRHLLAYAELAEEDLLKFQQRATRRLIALVVALLGAVFTLLMICVAVIAAAWDTPYRMWVILSMLAVFALITLAGLVMSLSRGKSEETLLAHVAREWRQDRALLERLLGPDEPPPAAPRDAARTSPPPSSPPPSHDEQPRDYA